MCVGDSVLYRGCAAHYLPGRPPYSDRLAAVLGEVLELDGSGTLIDVGCGPGILAVQLASLFDHVVGIDPDPDMLEEARRHGARSGAPQIQWVRAGAEDVALLDLPPARLVTFGQSFHWTERDRVTRAVYDLLEPGGSIALITHDIDARPAPTGPGDPSIPDAEVQDLIASYLGPDYRTKYRSPHWSADDRYEPALASSRFGRARTIYAPGRQDVTRDVDGVVSGYLSMSYAAPDRFGDQLEAFLDELRALLRARTTTGRFWDWPGETAIVIATKGE